MIVAETHRLFLRWLQPSDLEQVAHLLGNPEVMRFSSTGPLKRDQVRELIERFRALSAERGLGLWAIFHKADKRLIGCGGLLEEQVDGRMELGMSYRLDQRYWHRGFGTEAAKACRDYGFTRLRPPRLITLIEPANLAQIRIAEKLGMARELETVVYRKPVQLYALPRLIA